MIILKSMLAVVFLCTAASSHCPAECVPTEVVKIIRDGVAEVKQCDSCFNFCNTITTYRDSLRLGLRAKYDNARHVIFGYIDSLKRYQKADSVFYQGTLVGVDTSDWENVYISVFGELKGNLGVSKFQIVDSMVYVPTIPFATSFRGYDGRPFIAFLDSLPGVAQQNDKIGIGPVDGCYFEPQAYVISDSAIYKMGFEGERIPGVSLRVVDFLQEIGRPGLPIPTKRAVSIHPFKRRNIGTSHIRTDGRYWYDLKGRRLEQRIPSHAGDVVIPHANPGCRHYLY